MEEVLGLPPMNLNDALARPMTDIFNTTPEPVELHRRALNASSIGRNCPSRLTFGRPEVLPKSTHDAKYWARVTKGMDFD